MSKRKRKPDPAVVQITKEMQEAFADDWAKVELHRWQWGHLPGDPAHDPDCTEILDEKIGLLNMANALEKGVRTNDVTIMPIPMNVIAVMKYLAKKL